MFTDDYRKQSYLDVHCNWIERDFTSHRAALTVRHFGSAAHTAQNTSQAVNGILEEYGIPAEETPVTTDHGSNIVAALQNGMRVDCLCHRLHTVLERTWKETKASEPDAAGYESAISKVCRFVKQSTDMH